MMVWMDHDTNRMIFADYYCDGAMIWSQRMFADHSIVMGWMDHDSNEWCLLSIAMGPRFKAHDVCRVLWWEHETKWTDVLWVRVMGLESGVGLGFRPCLSPSRNQNTWTAYQPRDPFSQIVIGPQHIYVIVVPFVFFELFPLDIPMVRTYKQYVRRGPSLRFLVTFVSPRTLLSRCCRRPA